MRFGFYSLDMFFKGATDIQTSEEWAYGTC